MSALASGSGILVLVKGLNLILSYHNKETILFTSEGTKFNLSYHNKETILVITIDPYDGNLH